MSTMSRFRRLLGSTSPNALPANFSYCPTPVHEKPPKVGDSVVVISMRVMRASACGAANRPAAASAIRVLFMVAPVFGRRCALRQQHEGARGAGGAGRHGGFPSSRVLVAILFRASAVHS